MGKSLKNENQEQPMAKIRKDRKSVSMRVEPTIHKAIKRMALENDCLISDIVEDALKEFLIKHKQL